MSLYFQPSVLRSADNSLPTAPDSGLDVMAIIDELTNRINQASRKIEYMVDKKSLAKIILTDRDIVFLGDQVTIVGQLNIVDWIRDVSGNITGGVDPSSITRIVGGKIQTGIIQSVNWSVSAGSQFNLDLGTIVTGGSAAPKFSLTSSGVLTCVDAIVTGNLQAGSIIAGSVTINDALGPTLDEIASGVDVQAALTAGVTNILAGIGSDFRLNVDVANAYSVFQHKDAVFQGTAPAGSNKPALGISAAGIAIGYNRASDGQWVTSVAIDSSGNAAFLGTVTAGSIVSNLATVSGTSLGSILSMAQDGKAISDALEVSGTTILKGVLQPNNTGALATGSITWNSTTGALTGGTGVAITEWGIIGASGGTATFTIQSSTGAATFKGNINGGANIDITGTGIFRGVSSNPLGGSAIVANSGEAAVNGLVAYADTGGGGTAVIAVGGGLAVALNCDGRMTKTGTERVVNFNADLLDSKHGSSYCQIVVPNTGACTVSGNGINLISTISGTRIRGDNSNGLILEPTSDLRLKRNFTNEILGLDFIMGLRPKRYQLKDSNLHYHGFIAQQLKRQLPHEFTDGSDSLLQIHPDGMMGIDYISLIAPIIKSIQDLKRELDKLKN